MQPIKVHHWRSGWEKETYDVESFKFPGGELQVRIPDLPKHLDDVWVEARIQSSDDLMQLLLTHQVLSHQATCKFLNLILPYFPYARQDRMTSRTEAFSLLPFTELLNETNFSTVTMVDPHSDVTPALVSNPEVIEQHEVIGRFASLTSSLDRDAVLVAPDAGALKKARKVAKLLGLEVVTAVKDRDTATGEITGTRIDGVERVKGRQALIVDDICDGGRTFTEIALLLRRAGAKSNWLYVTHGIFSKGLGVFAGLIDVVFTTDSFLSEPVATSKGGGTPHPDIPLYVQDLSFDNQGGLL